MELSLYRQISDILDRSRKILIALPNAVTVDRLCSAYALHDILTKLGKEVTIATATPVLPGVGFLVNPPQVLHSLAVNTATVIHVATTHAHLEELSYQSGDDGVHIFLKPKEGQFVPEDVTVDTTDNSLYDAIIIIGAQTLENLNSLYEENSSLFFEKPKINIDIDPGNEYFGTVNLVDVTASSISEVIYGVIQSLESAVTDEHVATSLLAGIVAQTHSFQDPSTTPKTLVAASDLVAQGARQQDVIKHLYKTKEFSLLKLWGRALARLKTDERHSLLYSQLTLADFEKTGETEERLIEVMKELLENVTGFQLVVMMAEQASGVRILVAGLPHARIEAVANKFGEAFSPPVNLFGLYHVTMIDVPSMTLEEAEAKLLESVKIS